MPFRPEVVIFMDSTANKRLKTYKENPFFYSSRFIFVLSAFVYLFWFFDLSVYGIMLILVLCGVFIVLLYSGYMRTRRGTRNPFYPIQTVQKLRKNKRFCRRRMLCVACNDARRNFRHRSRRFTRSFNRRFRTCQLRRSVLLYTRSRQRFFTQTYENRYERGYRFERYRHRSACNSADSIRRPDRSSRFQILPQRRLRTSELPRQYHCKKYSCCNLVIRK